MENQEITNKDILDMLQVILERTERIDKAVAKIENDNRDINIKLETKIEPKLQAVLENQTEVINQKSHITKVETKVDDVKEDVDVLKFAVQEHSKDIEQLKKRA